MTHAKASRKPPGVYVRGKDGRTRFYPTETYEEAKSATEDLEYAESHQLAQDSTLRDLNSL